MNECEDSDGIQTEIDASHNKINNSLRMNFIRGTIVKGPEFLKSEADNEGNKESDYRRRYVPDAEDVRKQI